MDKIHKGILQGSILGNVFGGVNMASRGVGSAVTFDGVSSYVDFGRHAGECFHSPDACSAGITYSMWLWMGDNSNKRRAYILDSGGAAAGYAGCGMKLVDGDLYVLVKFGQGNKHQYTIKAWKQERWEHIAWIWHPTQGFRLYLNGCDTDPGAVKGMARYRTATLQTNKNFPFVLGDEAKSLARKANMKLDDVYIWYQVLTEKDVWTVYINGWPQ